MGVANCAEDAADPRLFLFPVLRKRPGLTESTTWNLSSPIVDGDGSKHQ
jgi:hypothetical protein